MNGAAIALELRRSGEEALIARGLATIADLVFDNQRAAAGQVSTSGLAPGVYDVSAIIRNGEVNLGIVSRRIAIVGP